jgi:hypothetical protein
VNSTQTYAQKYMNVRYFLEYPLGNTWKYAAPFYLLCNSTEHTLGFCRCLLLFRESVATLSYKDPLPSILLHTILELWHAPRLPKLCELCKLEKIVSLKEFCKKGVIPLLDFRLPELCELCKLEKIVSLKEFCEKGAIPLLDFRLPELCGLCKLKKIVSLKEFCEKRAIPLLDFEVTTAHFTFLALFHYLIYIVINFQRIFY